MCLSHTCQQFLNKCVDSEDTESLFDYLTMEQIVIVNTVWKGVVCTTFCLSRLCLLAASNPIVRTATCQNSQPNQLIIKFVNDATMLVFKTGKFRIIGKTLSHAEALGLAASITMMMHACPPLIELQTMTAVYTHPQHINLPTLATLVQGSEHKTQCHYDAEHFPAVQIICWNPTHVNVFASGKVIICGLKTLAAAEKIISELLLMLTPSNVHSI